MKATMKTLTGTVALVTGAGRGIGAATAKLLAERGSTVVLASRTAKEVEQIAAEIKKNGGSALAYTCDVSDEQQVRALFQMLESQFGKLDILINNAGAIVVKTITELSLRDWEHVFAANVRSTFLCSRSAFPLLNKTKGCIVNVSSIGGLRGIEKFKGTSSYVAAKFAIVGLTEALAVEGKELGIRVNCVAPGAVDTKMLRDALPNLKTNTTPADVAPTIVFLCEPQQSQPISGAVIEIHSNL